MQRGTLLSFLLFSVQPRVNAGRDADMINVLSRRILKALGAERMAVDVAEERGRRPSRADWRAFEEAIQLANRLNIDHSLPAHTQR